jgi:hypothetical protein
MRVFVIRYRSSHDGGNRGVGGGCGEAQRSGDQWISRTARPVLRRAARFGQCCGRRGQASGFAEGVTVDSEGNVYGADFLGDVRKFVKK